MNTKIALITKLWKLECKWNLFIIKMIKHRFVERTLFFRLLHFYSFFAGFMPGTPPFFISVSILYVNFVVKSRLSSILKWYDVENLISWTGRQSLNTIRVWIIILKITYADYVNLYKLYLEESSSVQVLIPGAVSQ